MVNMKPFVLLVFAVLQAINGEIQIYNDENKISFKSTDSFSLKCNYTVNDNIKILLGTNDVASCTTTFGTCSASDSRFTAAATISSTLPAPPNEFVVTATVGFSSALCGTYTCQGSTGSPSHTVDISWNKFSSASTSLSPLEPIAGESGALNITTDCLFPASDESLTINWYKTYQDGNADEALGASFEIYNETQRSTCTDTCGSDTDAKMVIGCRYTPPSNPGTGFQIKVEVMHKAYTDTLNWTFNGTYYDEVVTTTTTTTPTTTTPECSDCCCCDDKKARDGACGTVLAVCICVMAVLVFCCFKGFPPKHFQGKIVLICAVIAFIAALVGFILSAICLSKECSGSGDSCQVKRCFEVDTIAGFVIAGLSVLGTIVVVILMCLITGEPGSGKKKPVAEK